MIRWAGGKTRLLKHILPLTPTRIENYFEPFVGGGAVYLAIHEDVSGKAFLSDLNPHLVAGWNGLKSYSEELDSLLRLHEFFDSESHFYNVRSQEPRDETEMAARFLYLNATSWNHLWRENSKTGAMNAPWGKRSFRVPEKQALSEFSQCLTKAQISVSDFREALKNPKLGDFVYLDPPYLPIWTNRKEKEPTSKFNKYNAKTFELRDLEDLAIICRRLDQEGVAWMLSNRDTPEVRDLFSFGRFETFTTIRSLSAQSRRNVEAKQSPEILITGTNL